MTRLGIAFELIEHAQAGMVGQVDVEQDGARTIGRGGGQSVVGRVRDDTLKAALVGQVAQDGGEARIVFDDQQPPRVSASGGRGRPRSADRSAGAER